MSYGFELLNDAGEIVLNDTDSPVRLVREFTVAGVDHTLPNGLQTVRRFPLTLQKSTNFIFFKMPAQNSAQIGTPDGVNFYGSPGLASVTFREVSIFIEDLPPSDSGYCFEVYDAAGQTIYAASDAAPLVPIRRVLAAQNGNNRQTPFDTMFPTHALDGAEQWLCINVPRVGWECYNTQITGGFQQGAFWEHCGSVQRMSATSIRCNKLYFSSYGAPFVGTVGDYSVSDFRVITGI